MYKLEVNAALGGRALSQYFNEIVSDNRISTPDERVQMVKKLVGREITVEHNNSGTNIHKAHENKIVLSDKDVSIASMLSVAPDNLPPNIPPELTQELLEHLIALHEAEHATQFSHENVVSQTGHVVNSIKETMLSDVGSRTGFERNFMREVDGDFSIIDTLHDMEYENVAQFWLDMRASSSAVGYIFDFEGDAYEHDTSSILKHYVNTGEVIDPAEFMSEKRALAEKIRGEVGVFAGELAGILSEYPDFLKLSRDAEVIKEIDKFTKIKPQGIMHAVQTLLDEGQLEGMQEWEAENYMAAMDRLGYEPDPNYDYEAQLRDVLENKMGLKTADQIALEQQGSGLQGVEHIPIGQTF